MTATSRADTTTALVDIEYDITLEDYIAFNLDFADRSFLGKFSASVTYGFAILVWLGLPLCLVAFLLADGLDEVPEADAPGLFGFLVFLAGGFFLLFPVLMYFAIPWSLRCHWLSRWWIKRIVSEGKAGNLIGRYRLRLTPTTLTEVSPAAVTETRMNSVDRLIVTAQHAFVYTSPVQAFIVPRRVFAQQPDLFEQFVRTIEQSVPTRAIR